MNKTAVKQKKTEKIKKQVAEDLKDEPTEKIETMFQSGIIRRMENYKKDQGFLKMQEVVRVAVVYFLRKQGY